MCGRYHFIPDDNFYDRFEISNRVVELKPNTDVRPTQVMPVIVQHSPNSIEFMKWGFVRSWSPRPIINATEEKLQFSKVFKTAFESRRCLIPANGFYEWKPEGTGKQKYYIKLKGTDLFAFAGLYETGKDKDGNEVTYYTIITTVANDLVRPIHPKNRMPVILHPDDENTWLNPDNTDLKELQRLLVPYPADEMEAHPSE